MKGIFTVIYLYLYIYIHLNRILQLEVQNLINNDRIKVSNFYYNEKIFVK
jgi:hypothetical protein